MDEAERATFLARCRASGMDDEDAAEFLTDELERREAAVREQAEAIRQRIMAYARLGE